MLQAIEYIMLEHS